MAVNRNQMAPVNGLELCGEDGATQVETFDWVTIPNASIFSFQNMCNGAGGADCTIEVQACMIGGENNPETLVTMDATTGIMHHESDKAFDRIRADVTAYGAPGSGSNVLMSCR